MTNIKHVALFLGVISPFESGLSRTIHAQLMKKKLKKKRRKKVVDASQSHIQSYLFGSGKSFEYCEN